MKIGDNDKDYNLDKISTSEVIPLLEWEETYDNPIDMANIIGVFVDNIDGFEMIKKGVSLKSEQMQTLVEELLRLPNPNYTPYGRPIFVQMNTADIKKTLQ